MTDQIDININADELLTKAGLQREAERQIAALEAEASDSAVASVEANKRAEDEDYWRRRRSKRRDPAARRLDRFNCWLASINREEEQLPVSAPAFPNQAGSPGYSAPAKRTWIKEREPDFQASPQRMKWRRSNRLHHLAMQQGFEQFTPEGPSYQGLGTEPAILIPGDTVIRQIFGTPGATPGPGDYKPVGKLSAGPLRGATFEWEFYIGGGRIDVFANMSFVSPGGENSLDAIYCFLYEDGDGFYSELTAGRAFSESSLYRDSFGGSLGRGTWHQCALTADFEGGRAWLHIDGTVRHSGPVGWVSGMKGVSTIEFFADGFNSSNIKTSKMRVTGLPLYNESSYTPTSLYYLPPARS
jgi:hypothetical protein